MRGYALHGCDVPTLQKWAAQGHMRNLLQEAFINFITLQDIPYQEGFSCCEAESATADGLFLGFPASQAYFEMPWGPDEDAPLVWGSTAEHRMLVRKKELRQLIHQFCGNTPMSAYQAGSGLSPTEHGRLMALAQEFCPILLPMLTEQHSEGGSLYAAKSYREFLFNIASSAPASQHIPAVCFDLVDMICVNGDLSLLTSADERLLADHAPSLRRFITHQWGSSQLPTWVVDLLRVLRNLACEGLKHHPEPEAELHSWDSGIVAV